MGRPLFNKWLPNGQQLLFKTKIYFSLHCFKKAVQDEKAPFCGPLSNHHQPAPVYNSRGNGDMVRRVPLWKYLLVIADVYMWESGKETKCLSLGILGNCRSVMSNKKLKAYSSRANLNIYSFSLFLVSHLILCCKMFEQKIFPVQYKANSFKLNSRQQFCKSLF